VDANKLLRGVYNVTPTPFDQNGKLDEGSIKKLTDFVIDRGVNGLTILGMMGESAKVSETERERIIAGFLDSAAGRVPVCVGTSHAATDQCIRFSKQAQKLGATAVMVAPPALTRTDDTALRKHYLTVAEAIDIPILVQDVPESNGIYMSDNFIARIAEESPQCRFIKLEDPPAPPKITRILALNPNLTIFGGSGGLMFLEELKHGAKGTMTGFAFSEILVEIYKKFADGDIDGATETFYHYLPLIRFECQPGISLSIRKYTYYIRNAIESPFVREPSSHLKDTPKRRRQWILE